MSFGRVLWIAVRVSAVAILAPLSFCVALPIGLNELKAMTWARLYDQTKHPEGTERIALRYAVTKFSNGDNCDFLLLEARAYRPGQESEIQGFYASLAQPGGPFSNRLYPQFDDGAVGAGFTTDLEEQFRITVALADREPYYTLEAHAVVESAPPLIDWRCP